MFQMLEEQASALVNIFYMGYFRGKICCPKIFEYKQKRS